MKRHLLTFRFAFLGSAASLLLAGCAGTNPARIDYDAARVPALGQMSDALWQDQEVSAEAAKFVVYHHEFLRGSARLNTAGEDHVKQIAVGMQAGTPFPVVVERSMHSAGPGTYQYPINVNPTLDNERRLVIVSALRLMGIEDADQRVVVAPAFSEAATSQEAESSYLRGLQSGYNNSGFGGGFGGFGGGGFF
jgi:outer membrane murein-binding lipoprotein Lpp